MTDFPGTDILGSGVLSNGYFELRGENIPEQSPGFRRDLEMRFIMKRKMIAVLLIVTVAIFFAACGSGKKDTSGSKKNNTAVTKDKDSDSQTKSDNSGSDSQKTDAKMDKQSDNKTDAQKKNDSGSSSGTSSDSSSGSASDSSSGGSDPADKSTTGKGGEDDVEPGNADPTGSVAKDKSSDEMESLYVGTWTIKGVLLSDGSIDGEGVSGNFVIKSDGSYTADVTYADGSTDKGSGKWSVNSDKKLVAGSAVMGLDSQSRLLKDSGERDGKGNRLYYAFVKGK